MRQLVKLITDTNGRVFDTAKKPLRPAFLILSAAVLVAPFLAVIHASATPVVTEWPASDSYTVVGNITAGPDGAMWFPDRTNGVSSITNYGTINRYPVAASSVANGSDGAIWFTSGDETIGRLALDGTVSTYTTPTSHSIPLRITAGPDGAMWFTEGTWPKIGRITTDGNITEYPVTGSVQSLFDITAGPDGAMWFTNYKDNKIGRITTDGTIDQYSLPDPSSHGYIDTSGPLNITVGADGALWFAQNSGTISQIGRITTDGTITEYSLAAGVDASGGITSGPDGALWYSATKTSNSVAVIGSITTSGNFGAEISIPTDGTANFNGLGTATDGSIWYTMGGDHAKVGRLIVNPVDPTITSAASATTGMRTPFDFQVTTTGMPTASITATGTLPAGIIFTDNGDGTANLKGSAAAGTAGNYPITITADNGSGTPVTQLFTLTVTTAASPPSITSGDNDTETFGVPFGYTVTTDGYPVPKLTKTGTMPNGVTFHDNGDGTATISGTPAKSAMGVYSLLLTATSSAGTVNQNFTLSITKAPVIKKIANINTTVGTTIYVPVTARGYTTPYFSLAGALPAGVFFNDNGDGTSNLSGSPESGSGGLYSVTVTATNDTGSSSRSFTIKVKEPPTITSAPTATATVGSAFSFQATATGFPAPKITRTGALPKGVTWKASTGTLSGTPKANTAGTYPITFTATNASGTTTQTFNLIVE
ncbi:MAG: putative Ig domain-containing protein [Patescibacteria group bacterium]